MMVCHFPCFLGRGPHGDPFPSIIRRYALENNDADHDQSPYRGLRQKITLAQDRDVTREISLEMIRGAVSTARWLYLQFEVLVLLRTFGHLFWLRRIQR